MNTAYPLIPVTIIIFLAYFTTRLFVHWEIFQRKGHRKFWNYLLLVTFLVSGLLGLLSVVKVNYKLDIPGYENYLQWHVAFGIAMVFIAFFHLSWHLNYYLKFRPKKSKDQERFILVKDGGPEEFRALLLLLGMAAMINQVVFIREFISVLSGNELVVGIIMAAWMLLTGWGALHARRGQFSGFTLRRGIHMLGTLILLPIVLIALLYVLKNLMFPPGTIVNIGNSVVAAFLLLFPVCFLSGYLFTLFSTCFSVSGKSNLIGRSYALESLGSLLGGILFTIILGRYFNSFQIFGITAAIIFLAGAWIVRKTKYPYDWRLILPGTLIPILIFVINPDNLVKKMSFPNQELISSESTRYGNLVITRQAGQLNVYENHNLQFYTENIMRNEEAVHFAMIQHRDPREVLLISGGIAGMIGEIRKYDVERITYLESNPELFQHLDEYTNFDVYPETVEIVKQDIRNFAANTDRKFDVILINLPPPSSLGRNRFYTAEFFHILKTHCKPGTVISTTLPSTANYAEENALDANSSLWKTLGLFFKNRLLITGEMNYFLASDTILYSSITERIMEKNIPTEYVNSYFLDDHLLAMRSETLTQQFKESVPVNRDFYPYMFVKQISHWLSYFGARYHLLILIPVLIFIFLFIRTDRITAGLYTGGFTAASLEVTLLLAYQVYFGSIYLTTALFFAVFMGGLAFGSSLKQKGKPTSIRNYWSLQFGLALFASVLPFIIQQGYRIPGIVLPSQILFYILIFLLATAVGYEFLLASDLREKTFSETSGVNYSTDLAGSALGAFLGAIVLLPLIGLVATCMVVAGLNIISGLLAFSARKLYILSN